jgi:hypothetical protein
MKHTHTLFLILICSFGSSFAQKTGITVPSYLNFEINDVSKKDMIDSINKLFEEFDYNDGSKLINKKNYDTSMKLLRTLWFIEYKNPKISKEIINAYKISNDKYLLKILYKSKDKKNDFKIDAITSIIAIKKENKFTFSSPISHHTLNWKNKKIGNIEYFYKKKINEKVAKKFNANNSKISNKLSIDTDNLILYKCSNYQEVLKLIGLDYLLNSNGEIQSSELIGYTILTGLNSEDFSHDILHHYSSKLYNRKVRNWIAEEGLAYSWGNAYYTKENNKMISRNELVFLLEEYLKSNPQDSLLEIFINNKKIFNDSYSVTSARSVISSLLCDEIENKKGIIGIKKLISCGKGKDIFFKVIEELIGINKSNFNKKVLNLITLIR